MGFLFWGCERSSITEHLLRLYVTSLSDFGGSGTKAKLKSSPGFSLLSASRWTYPVVASLQIIFNLGKFVQIVRFRFRLLQTIKNAYE